MSSDLPERLRWLAGWFDVKYRDAGRNDEVQKDLRRFADEYERLQLANSQLETQVGHLLADREEQRAEIERLREELANAAQREEVLNEQFHKAREAARWIWQTRQSGISESAAIISRYPWLEEVSDA